MKAGLRFLTLLALIGLILISGYQDNEDDLPLSFPIAVILAHHSEQTNNNENELNDNKKDCVEYREKEYFVILKIINPDFDFYLSNNHYLIILAPYLSQEYSIC